MESKGELEIRLLVAENYDKLAKAIVKKAVDDYRTELRRLKYRKAGNRSEESYSYRVFELEQFFLSDWFTVLCNVDGQSVIDAMRKTVLR